MCNGQIACSQYIHLIVTIRSKINNDDCTTKPCSFSTNFREFNLSKIVVTIIVHLLLQLYLIDYKFIDIDVGTILI